MKLSFAISSHEWRKELKLLSDLGYEGVELGIREPERFNINALAKALGRYRLELSAIGTGRIYVEDGLSLCSLKKDIRTKAIERIKRHIDLASFFNTQTIIGLARGKENARDGTYEQHYKKLLDSTRRICDYAISKNVILLFEPLNRYETSFLNNVEQTLSFIKGFKCKNLKILLDIFHMNIEENNLLEPIRKGIGYLSHFHLADNNRRCPGDGCIDFSRIIVCLKQLGYKGYLSGEMLPLPSIEYCINKFFKVIKHYIKGY